MLGELIRIDWFSRRRSEDQVMAFWTQIVRARFRLQVTEKNNNPTLQFDGPTASRSFCIAEAPSPIQSPNAPDYADCLSYPVDVLPLQPQVLTRTHPCCERHRKRGAMRGCQSNLKKCLCLLDRQRTHFTPSLLRDFDTIRQDSPVKGATAMLAASQTLTQHVRNGRFDRRALARSFSDK